MADCTKTVEFFAEWNRLCGDINGACKGCPMYCWNHAENKENCTDHWYSRPEQAVEILQKWSDEHPVMTWKGKLRGLLPNGPIAQFTDEYCPFHLFGDHAPCRDNCYAEGTDACDNCWNGEYKEAP